MEGVFFLFGSGLLNVCFFLVTVFKDCAIVYTTPPFGRINFASQIFLSIMNFGFPIFPTASYTNVPSRNPVPQESPAVGFPRL